MRPLYLLLLALLAPAARADEAVAPAPLAIVIDAGLKAKDASALCAALGKRLVVGGAPFGLGVFSKASCAPAGAAKLPPWQLTVAKDGADLRLKLAYAGASCREAFGDAVLPERTLALPKKKQAPLLDLVALQLLDSLPMLGRVSKLSDGDWPSEAAKKLAAPPSLAAYDLAVDKEACIWVATHAGPARAAGGAWVHDPAGRGRWAARLAKLAAKLAASTLKRFDKDQKAAKGQPADAPLPPFLSAQIGLPLLRDVPLLDSAVQLGVGAGWRGLRFNFDMVPRVGRVESGEKTWFSSQRAVLGWSFDFHPGFAELISVLPHFGVWTLDTALSVTDPDGNRVIQTFKLQHAACVGLELGMAFKIGSLSVIPKYNVDGAYSLVDKAASHSTAVGASRFGLQFNHVAFNSVHLIPFAFAFYEADLLDDRRTNAASGDQTVQDKQLSFAQAYVGLGMRYLP